MILACCACACTVRRESSVCFVDDKYHYLNARDYMVQVCYYYYACVCGYHAVKLMEAEFISRYTVNNKHSLVHVLRVTSNADPPGQCTYSQSMQARSRGAHTNSRRTWARSHGENGFVAMLTRDKLRDPCPLQAERSHICLLLRIELISHCL